MPAQDTSNLRGNQWEVFLNDDPSPFMANVSVGPALDPHPVMTQRHGTTPIDVLVQGHKGELTFEAQEWTLADLKRWNGITATASVNKLPPVGSSLPKVHVRLHNAGDGEDTSRDFVYPKVAFTGMGFNIDGTAEHKQQVSGTAVLDPSVGDLVQIGYVE